MIFSSDNVNTYGDPAMGTRQWRVKSVKTTCPNCESEVEIDVDELIDDWLWHGEPFEQECPWCHKYFWVGVEDDDH